MSNLLLLMSFILGAGSFLVGILPLSFVFSKNAVSLLSTLGTGLLVGTALGVIIPEGVETVVAASRKDGITSEIPTSTIALSLLSGFVLMLVVEQVLHSGHGHSSVSLHGASSGAVEFDAELGELEREQGPSRRSHSRSNSNGSEQVLEQSQLGRFKALPLTLGLFVHALADGLALGASFLPTNSNEPSGSPSSELSLVVFLALLVHKAPTALALTTSLLATSLPRAECKKHLALFSASTPIGAIMSYYLIYTLGLGSGHDWTGPALLFSGGTFLYVATVLQPVSGNALQKEEISSMARVILISVGMFIPFTLGALLGHGHEHA